MKAKLDEIVLHVGLHKTGTTSIQETFQSDHNKKLLETRGYLWPRSLPDNMNILYIGFLENPKSLDWSTLDSLSEQDIREIVNSQLGEFEKEVCFRKLPKLIISSEDLSWLGINDLKRFRDYLTSKFLVRKFKVIIYVRNPVNWAISFINQNIKHGASYNEAIDWVMDNELKVLRSRIEKFEIIFGRNSISMFKFEEAVDHEYGLVGHFSSNLGLSSMDLKKIQYRNSNESISLLAGQIISYINEKLPNIVDGQRNKDKTDEDLYVLRGIRGPKFDINYEDKEKLYTLSKETIKWLSDQYDVDYALKNNALNTSLDYNISTESILDIRNAYFKLNRKVKKVLLEYLGDSFSKESNNNKRLLIELFKELSELNTLENQIFETIGLNENLYTADFLREIALYMEYQNQIGAAKYLMGKALEIRPHDSFVSNKYHYYEEITKNNQL